MPSYYNGHGIGVWMEKSNHRNNSGDRYGNYARRYCIPATKPIYVSIKVSVGFYDLKKRKPHESLAQRIEASISTLVAYAIFGCFFANIANRRFEISLTP